MNTMSEFKEKFWKWELNSEKIQDSGWPICPFAKAARLENKIQFFDARNSLECVNNFDRSNDIGVAWLGETVNEKNIKQELEKLRENNKDLDILFSRPGGQAVLNPNFTNVLIIHNADDIMRKRRHIYEAGYYDFYPSFEYKQEMDDLWKDIIAVYPLHKKEKQSLGTNSVVKVFDKFVDSGSILDIGGSAGNLYEYRHKKITKYTCIDISSKAILLGQRMYPKQTFIHYNKKNWLYNISGDVDTEFPRVDTHEYVFINSVFTSTDYKDMIDMLDELVHKFSKKIIFSVFDKDNKDMLLKIKQNMDTKEFYTEPTVDFFNWNNNKNKICYLYDNFLQIFDKEQITSKDLQNTEMCHSFLSAYNIEWLTQQLAQRYKNYKIQKYVLDFDTNFVYFTITKGDEYV